MPETEVKSEDKKQESMVPIDNTGPEVDVELPTPKTSEVKKEQKEETEEPVVAPTAKAKKEIEEKPKDELDDYSVNVKKRIEKLTYKLREAERQREEALNFANNKQNENASLKNKFLNLDETYIKEYAERVNSESDTTKEALKTAIESGDTDKIVELNQKIANLAVEQARNKFAEQEAAEQKKKAVETNQELETARSKLQQPAKPDPKAEGWAVKNPWFGTDEAMTYTAFAIHRKLVEQEGFDPQSDEYYAEIDKRIRVDFPQKFNEEIKTDVGQQRPAQTVASANRVTKSGRKTVRLTPSQVAIAKKLGVPLEEYAKYVKEDN